ncbi:hypothetical protein E2F50_19470 [Rhizobium deserti]|uniref:Uncharacterized protein n=1 Tax=Rhizobium deserti TaxID=2547961 RepID=A0A4R5UAK4_9HYPH|nr:hypothetical protein [Rhizobium deserti]TDK31842.1 hypothetical protein E2F50_19470 [Rhizobium deserti]
METRINSARQAVETLKSLPVWLFLGFTCFFGLSLAYQPFRAVLEEHVIYVQMAATLCAIMASAKLLDSLWRVWTENRKARAVRDLHRLIDVYRPIYALFLTRRPSMAQAILYNTFFQRLAHARREFSNYAKWCARISNGWRALFDRGVSVSWTIQHRGGFPISQIVAIVAASPRDVTQELLNLVGWAESSRAEDPCYGFLTEGEIALFLHITQQHNVLSKRLD